MMGILKDIFDKPIYIKGVVGDISIIKSEEENKVFLDTKFNPHHDPRSGRFSSGGTGGEGLSLTREKARKRSPNEIKELSKKMIEDRGLMYKIPGAEFGIKIYTSEKYKGINNSLKKGKSIGDLKNPYEMAQLDKACKKPIDTVIFRGLREKAWKKRMKDIGDDGVLESKTFVSTSISVKTAMGYATELSGKGTLHVMEIKAKRGVIVTDMSVNFDEYEVVQSPGTKYKYKGVNQVKLDSRSGKSRDVNIYMFEEI